MSYLIPPVFRPLHAEAASPSDPSAPTENANANGNGLSPYVIPHLPGEGRFTVSAKVRSRERAAGMAVNVTPEVKVHEAD